MSGQPYARVREEPRGFFSAYSWAREPGNIWRSPDLELSASQIDGSVDANGMVAYLEWTMTFENKGWMSQEARSLIQLPPGALASRLTLWVNGEPREAAFAGRSQVTQAYNAVVSRRQDPVLVTTRGMERIFVQCFPVMPRTPMKIRVGFTIPLWQDGEGRATLLMPYMLDRNFELAGGIEHA